MEIREIEIRSVKILSNRKRKRHTILNNYKVILGNNFVIKIP